MAREVPNSAAHDSEPSSRARRWIALALLTAIAAVHFEKLRSGQLMHDDWYHIEHGLGESLASSMAQFSPFSPETQAVSNLQWWLLPRLFGVTPLPYHLVGMLWHFSATLLLFCLTCRLGLGAKTGLLIAMLFGVHPALQGTVSWVSTSIEYGCCQTFLLGALLCYLDGRRRAGKGLRREMLLYLASGVLFFAATKSKPQAVFFPGILVLLHLLEFVEDKDRRRNLGFHLKAAIRGQALHWSVLVLFVVQVVGSQHGLGPAYRTEVSATNIAANFNTYLGPVLFQWIPAVLFPVLAGLTLAWASIPLVRRSSGYREGGVSSPALLGWAWCLMAFSPVITLVTHASGGHVYIPLAGMCLIIATFIARPLARLPWVAVGILCAIMLWFLFDSNTRRYRGLVDLWAKTGQSLADLRRLHVKPPANAHFFVYPRPPLALFDSGFGSAVKVIYGRQDLLVTIADTEADIVKAIAGEPTDSVRVPDEDRYRFDPKTQKLLVLRCDEKTGSLQDATTRFRPH